MLIIRDKPIIINNLIWIACNNTIEKEQCWGGVRFQNHNLLEIPFTAQTEGDDAEVTFTSAGAKRDARLVRLRKRTWTTSALLPLTLAYSKMSGNVAVLCNVVQYL